MRQKCLWPLSFLKGTTPRFSDKNLQSRLTFLFAPLRFVDSRCYGHGELMGVATESQKELAFVIASAVESELVRLIDRAYLELLALCMGNRADQNEILPTAGTVNGRGLESRAVPVLEWLNSVLFSRAALLRTPVLVNSKHKARQFNSRIASKPVRRETSALTDVGVETRRGTCTPRAEHASTHRRPLSRLRFSLRRLHRQNIYVPFTIPRFAGPRRTNGHLGSLKEIGNVRVFAGERQELESSSVGKAED